MVRVPTAEAAGQTLLDQVPVGAEVMSGSSTTLDEIGFEDLLGENSKGSHDYHAAIAVENDDARRQALWRRGVTADWPLSGVQVIAETGHFVGWDRTRSRVGA